LREVFSGIWQAASTLLGVLVFAAVMWWLAKAHSRLWRTVSADYPKRSNSSTIARKTLDTIVITRRGTSGPVLTGNVDYRQYAGALIRVHDSSLSVSLLPPFNISCAPIELPFDEMELRPTVWALWPEPFAVRMRRLPGLDLVLARDTVQWIRARTDKAPFGLGA
jgi:hypothetical protein